MLQKGNSSQKTSNLILNIILVKEYTRVCSCTFSMLFDAVTPSAALGSQWLVEGTLLVAVVVGNPLGMTAVEVGNPLDMAAVVAYTEEEVASLAADSTVVVVVGLRRSELLTH